MRKLFWIAINLVFTGMFIAGILILPGAQEESTLRTVAAISLILVSMLGGMFSGSYFYSRRGQWDLVKRAAREIKTGKK